MTALTASKSPRHRTVDSLILQLPIGDGDEIFLGGLVGEIAGRARAYVGEDAGETLVGIAVSAGDEDGEGLGTDPDGVTGVADGSVQVGIHVGAKILERQVIANLAAATQVGNVAFPQDDNDWDANAIGTTPAAGLITRFHSANLGDVLVFPYWDQVVHP